MLDPASRSSVSTVVTKELRRSWRPDYPLILADLLIPLRRGIRLPPPPLRLASFPEGLSGALTEC
jgi:hypothetical protein